MISDNKEKKEKKEKFTDLDRSEGKVYLAGSLTMTVCSWPDYNESVLAEFIIVTRLVGAWQQVRGYEIKH